MPSTESANPDIGQHVRAMQTVFSAMCAGTLLFMAVATVVGPVQDESMQGPRVPAEMLRFVLWGFALVQGVMMFVLYSGRTKAIALATTFDEKIGLIRGRLIVITALAEFVALLAGVVTMLVGNPLLSLPGLVPMLVWIVIGFPTQARFEAALSAQPELLNREYRK